MFQTRSPLDFPVRLLQKSPAVPKIPVRLPRGTVFRTVSPVRCVKERVKTWAEWYFQGYGQISGITRWRKSLSNPKFLAYLCSAVCSYPLEYWASRRARIFRRVSYILVHSTVEGSETCPSLVRLPLFSLLERERASPSNPCENFSQPHKIPSPPTHMFN